MSLSAPWLALSTDWQNSAMFDGASQDERHAWVCLLCHAKSNGRAGRARFRASMFAQEYRLSIESVAGMIDRAIVAGAVTVDNETVTITNWRAYQDPRARTRSADGTAESCHFSKTAENDATTHPPPSQPSPPTKNSVAKPSGVSVSHARANGSPGGLPRQRAVAAEAGLAGSDGGVRLMRAVEKCKAAGVQPRNINKTTDRLRLLSDPLGFVTKAIDRAESDNSIIDKAGWLFSAIRHEAESSKGATR